MKKISDTVNVTNLLKAADWIEENVKDEQFDIICYRADEDNKWREKQFYNLEACGTIGCFLGWCPFVPGLEPIEHDYTPHFGEMTLNFDGEYSKRIFGLDSEDGANEIFCYLFWPHELAAGGDNSRKGVIKRVRDLCKNGLPDNWRDLLY